jgi:hypothetical protein
MTAMQRQACLSLGQITFGHFPTGARRFVRSMIERAESDRWESITLTGRQLAAVARTVRRFRRQVNNPHVLFWAQRILVELAILQPNQEEPCQQQQ